MGHDIINTWICEENTVMTNTSRDDTVELLMFSYCSSLKILEFSWSTQFRWRTWQRSVVRSFTGSTRTGHIVLHLVVEVLLSAYPFLRVSFCP